ncbi:recombinase family protein [Aquifex pyrophilus]
MRGAIYARYSTEKQNAKSIEDQIRICRDYADRNGITIVAHYTDRERSGYTLKREGLLKLLGDAKKKLFDTLLVEHTSRLSRDGLELRRLIKEFQKLGITVIFVSQNLRTDRQEDIALIKLLNVVDEQYIEGIRIATRRGLEGALLRGKWVSSAPYGYKMVNSTLQINEEEAKVVREVFERYANGEGLRLICYSLNERGIKPRRARTWSTSTLSGILRNPIYKGQIVWGRRKRIEDEKIVVIQNPKEPVVLPAPHLAIVPEEIWERANKRLEENKYKGRHKKVKHTHPLAGIVICGHCGKPLGKERNRLICYEHRTKKACDFDFRLDYDVVLSFVLKLVKEFILERKEEILKAVKRLKTGTDKQEKIAKLEKKLENLLELYAEAPSDTLKRKIKEIEKEIEKLKGENESFSFDLNKALENLEKLSWREPEFVNETLKTFIRAIIVRKKDDAIIDMKVEASPILARVLQKVMVSRAGLEPATHGLKGRCSTN